MHVNDPTFYDVIHPNFSTTMKNGRAYVLGYNDEHCESMCFFRLSNLIMITNPEG